MKEIFDWLREAIERVSLPVKINGKDAQVDVICLSFVSVLIAEAEAKWKEKEAELRASVIDEFSEAIMVKATEESEKVVFDGRLVGDALSLDCVSDMVLDIALQMKGEKE